MSVSPHRRRVACRPSNQILSDPTRTVIRRRRCSESPPPRARLDRGNAWRQTLLVALTLLAAGPVWAIGEAVVSRYHEAFAVFVRQARPRLDWLSVSHPQAAPSGSVVQSAPASNHAGTGTFDRRPTSARNPATGDRVSSKAANVAARPDGRASAPAPRAGWPGVPESAGRPAFAVASRTQTQSAARTAASVASTATVKPAFVTGTYTWTGLSAATPLTPDPSWTTAGNWSNGTTAVVPPNNGGSTIEYTINPVVAAATNVNVNYSIAGLVYQGLTGTVGATDTPSYNLTGSPGVSLTVGAGGITDNSANLQTITVPVVLGAAQAWNVSTAAGALTVDGAISGGNGLTSTGVGTLTLTGNNTYSGGTIIEAGKFFVNNVPAKAGDSGTGGGTVYVEPSAGGTWLGGTGTIGGNTVVGDFPPVTPTIRDGLRPQAVAGMATLTPGVAGPGVLTFNGNLTLTAGTTTTELDIAGASPGTGYDQVKVGGNLTLAGNLTLNLAAGAKPSVGETFYIFNLTSTAGTLTGTFANANPDGTFTDAAGDVYVINYDVADPADGDGVPNDVSLTVMAAPEPSTWVGLLLGGVGIWCVFQRRRRTLG